MTVQPIIRRADTALDSRALWALNDLPNIGHTANNQVPLALELPTVAPVAFPDLADVHESFIDRGGEFLIAEFDGHVVGMAGFKRTPTGAEVLRVRVHPAVRRQRVGAQLMRELEKRAASYGISRLHLDTADNQPDAIAFYNSIGYREVGRHTEPAWSWTLVYFQKDLHEHLLSDGVITLRRQEVTDLKRHLEATDDEQINWLWEPGSREQWEAMSPEGQRLHQLAHLRSTRDGFGSGPKWAFSGDLPDFDYAVYIDCDLANPHVPHGQANISYATHPAQRGKGHTSRAVRLICRFLIANSAATEAHILVKPTKVNSLRVAQAVGAVESERFVNEHGQTLIRHVLRLDRHAEALTQGVAHG